MTSLLPLQWLRSCPIFAQALEDAVASHDVIVECRLQLSSGGFAHVRSFMRHAPDANGRLVRGISIDITNQKKLEAELYQAQKLESVGRLAAGVAHEINTTVQLVNGNCYFLRDAVLQIGDLVRTYQAVFAASTSGQLNPEQARERLEAAERAADLNILVNAAHAIEGIVKGTGQALAIARSIIVDKHHGSLTFESVAGVGTTFLIRLPLDASAVDAVAA